MNAIPELKTQLRQEMLQLRNQLTSEEIRTYSLELHSVVKNCPMLVHANRIGFYFSHQKEIATTFLLEEALRQHKKIFLPALQNTTTSLVFLRKREGTKLIPNKYGIMEPDPCATLHISAQRLEVVFVPLVAFDAFGNRLGMGGGYYDKTFAFKKLGKQQPILIGLAYDFQQVDTVPHDTYDIKLDYVITPSTIMHFG
ncbi:MAG TPA: 5-formyltetrahydrofolate cyclo-ligase [Gammaproteobacteria bacterium]|nr:5-formyltetrahydrofolate cyclo-ligase [Gammaproteobacteria bacterium]